jgi:hypothetical protein
MRLRYLKTRTNLFIVITWFVTTWLIIFINNQPKPCYQLNAPIQQDTIVIKDVTLTDSNFLTKNN